MNNKKINSTKRLVHYYLAFEEKNTYFSSLLICYHTKTIIRLLSLPNKIIYTELRRTIFQINEAEEGVITQHRQVARIHA